MKKFTSIVCLVALSACAQPVLSLADQSARKAALMRYTTQNCGGFVGDIQDIKLVKETAMKEQEKALALGATQKSIEKEQSSLNNRAAFAIAMVGRPQVCSEFVNEIADHL